MVRFFLRLISISRAVDYCLVIPQICRVAVAVVVVEDEKQLIFIRNLLIETGIDINICIHSGLVEYVVIEPAVLDTGEVGLREEIEQGILAGGAHQVCGDDVIGRERRRHIAAGYIRIWIEYWNNETGGRPRWLATTVLALLAGAWVHHVREIGGAIRQKGHLTDRRDAVQAVGSSGLLHTFIGDEQEGVIFADGAADRAAIVVLREIGGDAGRSESILLGSRGGRAIELIGGTVDMVASGFCLNGYDAATGLAKLGVVAGGRNLELLDGVHARSYRDVLRTIGCRFNTVELDRVRILSLAVHGIVEGIGIAGPGSHSGHQSC